MYDKIRQIRIFKELNLFQEIKDVTIMTKNRAKC